LLLSIPGSEGAYWKTFLLPIVVIGFGMSVAVAPLTTTVLNSVPEHQTGVASGINNAVAQVASLMLIAILSTVGVSTLNRSLDGRLAAAHAAPEVHQVVEKAQKGFIMPGLPPEMAPKTKDTAHTIIADSFVEAIRRVLLIAVALSIASALPALLTIPP